MARPPVNIKEGVGSMNAPRRIFTRAMSLLAAVVASLALASPAFAEELPAEETSQEVAVEQTAATTQTCQDPTLVQPFTTFGDVRDYVLAPFGDFEHATLDGWTLEGGAGPVADEDGNGALGLPAGSTATSPAMCIDLNYPTVRFFVRNMLDDDADLKVQVMYVDHEKAYKPHDVKKLKAGRGYGLTKDIKIDPQRGGKEAGWRRIAFRFVAAKDKGDFRVDQLYVDPRLRG
jgi:hypothetical protein